MSQFGIRSTQKLDTLYQDQTKINQEIKSLDYQIETITRILNKLQEEHGKLQKQIQDYDSNAIKLTPTHNEKTIVLHGLPEPY